jgi:hypothetical protein
MPVTEKEMLKPRIERSLAEAEARLAELEGKLAPLYLDEALDPSVAAERKRLEREVAEARATVERFRLAEQEAARRDYRASAEQRISELKVQQVSFEKVLTAHREAAADLDSACEALAKSYRRLQASSALLRRVAPMGELPMGYVPIHPRHLLEHQLHRVSGSGAAFRSPEGPLPGSHSPSIELQHRPDGVETATAQIGGEVDYLRAAVQRSLDAAAAVLRDEQPSEEEAA